MLKKTRIHIKPYVVAILSVFAATVLTQLLNQFLSSPSFALYYGAVAFTTWYGGRKPGLLAIALFTMAISYLFLAPINSLAVQASGDILRLIISSFVCLLINYLVAELKTAKQQIEQLSKRQLQESEKRLKLALDAAQFGIWDWNLQTGEINWSLENEKLFGMAPGSFDGRYETFNACVHPEDRDNLIRAVEKARQERSIYYYEFRVIQSDGSARWMEGKGQFFYDETGQAVRMMGTTADIDKRKQAEFALYESEEKFRRAVLDSPMPTMLHAEDGQIILVNQIWMNITGYTHPEIPTIADWTEKAYGERRETVRADIDRLYRLDERIAEGEYKILTKAGESRVWDFCSAPLGRLSDGRRLVISTALDITKRKFSEEALRKSEEKFSTIFHSSPDAIAIVSKSDGKHIDVNKAFSELFGYSYQEIIGRTDIELGIWTDLGNRNRVIELLEREGKTRNLEIQLRVRSGEIKTILLSTENIEVLEQACVVVFIKDITHRKQVEFALQKAKEELENRVAERTAELTLVNDRLLSSLIEQERDRQILQEQAQLLDLAHDTIMTRDFNGKIAFWNHGAEQMYGFSKSEALGKQNHFLLQTQLPQDLAEIQAKLIYQGYWEGELIQTRRDGSFIVVASRWVLQKDDAGNPIKILEINNNITAKKEAESALRRSEANLRQAQKIAHIGSWEYEFATQTTIWTEEFYRICGRDFNTPPLNLYEIYNKIIYSKDKKIYLKNIVQKIKKMQTFETDLRIIQTNGEIRYMEARGEPIFNERGELISFIGSVLDITDRKQAEATLEEANRRWRSLLDNVQLMVVGLDHMGNVDYVNPFFLKVSGYELTEVMGKDWFGNFLPLSHRQQVNTVFYEVLKHNFHPYYQNPILAKSGEERFIAWNNTLLQDVKGNIIGTISIGEDITQRQIVEQMKNEFISIVSHELRTPLTAIHGSLGLLATGIYDNKPEKARRMVQIAVTDSERLVKLVNDILDLERLDSGRVTLVKETCDATALMQRSVEGVQPIADRQAITLFVVPASVTVWAAPDAIVQTLTNLLSNAIKFSPPNSTISLSAQIQSDYILFKVKDRGRGIPTDKLETIFGRFQQVDASDSRQKGGTGLGLAICKSIVQQHGGRIWVESILGEGSTFYFTLAILGEELENDEQTNFSS